MTRKYIRQKEYTRKSPHNIPSGVVQLILQMIRDNVPKSRIARETGVSRLTVYRMEKKYLGGN